MSVVKRIEISKELFDYMQGMEMIDAYKKFGNLPAYIRKELESINMVHYGDIGIFEYKSMETENFHNNSSNREECSIGSLYYNFYYRFQQDVTLVIKEEKPVVYDRKFLVSYTTNPSIYGTVNITLPLSEKIGTMLSFDEISLIRELLKKEESNLKDKIIIILNIIECR